MTNRNRPEHPSGLTPPLRRELPPGWGAEPVKAPEVSTKPATKGSPKPKRAASKSPAAASRAGSTSEVRRPGSGEDKRSKAPSNVRNDEDQQRKINSAETGQRTGATVIKINRDRPEFTPEDARILRGLINAEREADRQAQTNHDQRKG